jgi:serine/threonine protein phosphatase PrpC
MMMTTLRIAFGQRSVKGRKAVNQDFSGIQVPSEPLLGSKGAVAALADGISSSDVSHIASETAVCGFLEDYYATPESWSVKTAAQRVLNATNSWLYAQTRNGPNRYVLDRGYVCTFSAIIVKSATVHLFHVGDTRIHYLAGDRLEQLTEDHRLWASSEQSYLSRALGMGEHLEIDYQSYPLEVGDTFVLMTDGVYEFAPEHFIATTIHGQRDDLDRACHRIVEEALRQGSGDNLSIQVVRIDALPEPVVAELHEQATTLPLPPPLRPRMAFEGYEILRELHNSHRSHVYLALDRESRQRVALKVPSVELRGNPLYLERFLTEEWVARRLDNVHILKAVVLTRKRHYLYTVTEYVEGQTLTQWMTDNPLPDLETVRDIVEQIARGLQALHRQEMLHQDLRPNNVMIDRNGTVKLIDFGSVHVAGIAELAPTPEHWELLGTVQYTAPEYFLGEAGSNRSDIFALGVIAYQMLSGRTPYGTQVAKTSTRATQRRLVYRPVLDEKRAIPVWIDGALRKAVQVNPSKRYEELSEFIYDLRHPNERFLHQNRAPLLERNPLLFWKGISFILFIIVLALLSTHLVPVH